MSRYLNDFVAALRVATATAWPDVAENGIWELHEIERIPTGDLPLPCAVLVIPQPTPGEWGLANRTYEVRPQVWRLQKADSPGYLATDAVPDLRNRLEDLRDLLLEGDLESGQVLEDVGINWQAENAVNRFMILKQWWMAGGYVEPQCLIGDVAG